MHAGRRGFPDGVKPGDRGPPVHVGPDAAAGVVRAGRDRDRLGNRVDSPRPAQGRHRGEVPLQRGPAQRGGVQPEVIAWPVPASHPLLHGRRHDVPGGQVAERMTPGHDGPARHVHQHCACPAQGLGDEGALALGRFLPQHRRVKLHELQVPQLRSGPGGQRQAVAGQPGRVGGGRVGLAEAAGGQDDGARRHRAHLQCPVVAGHPRQHPADRALVVDQGVQGDAAGEDPDRAGQQRRPEDPVNLRADRVSPGVHDPLAAVPGFEMERRSLQPGATPGQAGDLARGLAGQRGHGGWIAQAGARIERVPLMQARVVPGADRGGQAALGERRRAPADVLLLLSSSTLRPCRAAVRAAVMPAAPDPTTTTSASRSQCVCDQGRWRSSGPVTAWPARPAGRGWPRRGRRSLPLRPRAGSAAGRPVSSSSCTGTRRPG